MNGCTDFSCGDPRTCPGCWAAAYLPGVAGALGRAPRGGATPPPAGATAPAVCPYERRVVRRCSAGRADVRNLGHVRGCAHPDNPTGVATRGPNVGGAAGWSCAGCEHHPARSSVALWPGWADPIPDPYWPVKPVPAAVRRMHKALTGLAPPPPPTCAGDGVVICGEGRYWPGIYVLVRMLRERGCALPVEVWHRPSHGPVYPGWVADLTGIEFVDADHLARAGRNARVPPGVRGVGGYETKLYALVHSRFRRVVNLDADTYPVADVGELLPHTDHPSGLAGWRGSAPGVRWDRLGWAPAPDDVPLTLAGGMLALDKSRAWPVLWATHWMCQHSDFYFPAHHHRRLWPVFGDDRAMRVASWLHGVAPNYLGDLRSNPRIGYVVDLDGRPFLSHRWVAKMTPENVLYGDAAAMRHFADALELARGHNM